MKNFHLIQVTYMPATNTLPTRIKLSSARFEQSIIIPYGYNDSHMTETAERYLQEKGFEIVGLCELGKGDMGIITNTFKGLK